jgi:pimeloyl-ACP methyl ester carboxylesterase
VARGDLLTPCRQFAKARFPVVDGPAREQALARCVQTFDTWRMERAGAIERLDLDVPGGKVPAWATGLSPTEPRPLLVVMGGIVSVKEQWAAVLPALRRWGLAVVVTELPGVGENGLPYRADSWRMLSGLLDALSDRADVSETYALALSFSGHLALRCAVTDPRIRGVVTTNVPVHDFFTDAGWRTRVPRLTLDTLRQLTGDGPLGLAGWALTADELESLRIPVHAMVSRRDEIVPPADAEFLRRHVSALKVLDLDDVHGSPAHTLETRLWTGRSVLRISKRMPAQRVVLGALLAMLRARRRAPSGS